MIRSVGVCGRRGGDTGPGVKGQPVPVKEPLMITDPTITRIGEGVELHHHRGQREAARDLFAQIWDDIGGEQGDPLHVCVHAHAMADVQDDAHQW